MSDPLVPTIPADDLPWLTTDQMVEVDQRVVSVNRIGLMQMMENAGRHLARLAVDRYGLHAGLPSVVVLAGKGGNGGGALVAARRLHGWGLLVSVILSAHDDLYSGAPARQLASLAALRIPIAIMGAEDTPSVAGDKTNEVKPSLIIDGLIGYSLDGDPRGPTASLVQLANAASVPVLSLDVPSGVDATTGIPADPAVKADATLTLALPKAGLRAEAAADYVGDLYVADISVPRQLYSTMGIDVPDRLFSTGEIVRITR